MYQKYKIGQIFGKLTRKKKNIKSFRIRELKTAVNSQLLICHIKVKKYSQTCWLISLWRDKSEKLWDFLTWLTSLFAGKDKCLSKSEPGKLHNFVCICPHPSITDGVHRNENFVAIIPVFSTFSNFFKKKKTIKAILCNFSMRLLKYF